MEEDLDVLEDEVAGLPHLEGEGVAVKPDTDDEEALEEVLDRARAGKQQSTRSTQDKYSTFPCRVMCAS